MSEWKFPIVRVTNRAGFFVEVDGGYVGYGLLNGEYTVERISHFYGWDCFKTLRDVKLFARDLLDDLKQSGLWLPLA